MSMGASINELRLAFLMEFENSMYSGVKRLVI